MGSIVREGEGVNEIFVKYLLMCDLSLFGYIIGCTNGTLPLEREWGGGREREKREKEILHKNVHCVQITQLYIITNNDHPFIRFQRDFLIQILIVFSK